MQFLSSILCGEWNLNSQCVAASARTQPMPSVSKRVLVWFRRHRLLTASIVVALASPIVPLAPFVPECEPDVRYHVTERVWGWLTPEYRAAVKRILRLHEVYYWDAGGIILLRILPFFDGNRLFDQDDAVWDATYKAAGNLTSEVAIRFMIKEGLIRPDYRMPDYAKQFGELDISARSSCVYIRSIALGRPPKAN